MHAFQNDDKMKGQVCFERLNQIENEVHQGAMMSNPSEFEALMREQTAVNIDDVAANARDEQILALIGIAV